MASCGLGILMCLSAIVATALSHALPTQDTFVITTSDNPQSVTETSTNDLITDEPEPPIKVAEMDVRSEITMRYAHTSIVTRVQNPAKRAQEASFRVLLPDTAFISGFVMTLDGKSYKAYVKEKEEAKKIYSQAVSQGYGAAHISAKARDSNVFTVTVNVEGKSIAIFNLTYEELLTRKNGVYNHCVNLHPGTVVPKLTVVVHIKETQSITDLRVPEVRTGNEVDATEEDAQNKNAVIQRGAENREATITFTPDLEEQKRLIQIYKEKSKERRGDRYGYDEETSQDGILGQFVVQYDVDRSKGSDILVNDGYFVHFFAPTSLPPLSKHVVFVLDTSGSMMGRKMTQLIAAMLTILDKLNKGDVFNIVQFESSVQILDIKSAIESAPAVNRDYSFYREDAYTMPPLLPPVEATPENIAKAKRLVSALRAGGGTNIGTALDVAIALIQKGSKIGNTDEATTVSASNEPQANNTATEESNNVAKVEDKVAEKEPIVIFLTDGDPTVGDTSPTRIIKVVAEKNYGKSKASIFSLAFGEDADRNFLRKLSLKNDGFMRHIYEASDASLQLRDFYRQISSPLLADVKFVYPPDQVKEGSLTKSKFRRYYAGSEAIVAGRIEENIGELSPHIYGYCGVGVDDVGRKPYEVTTKAPVEHGKDSYLPLERLWAYLTIQQLLDERHITDLSDTDDKSPAKKALQLALKYEFVTALTSLVVVKPNATSAVDAESADKVSSNNYPALPSGLSFAPQRASSTYMAAQLSVPSHAGQSFYSGQLLAHALGQNSYPIALSGMPSPFADRLESPYLEEEDDDDTYHLLPVAYSRMPIAYSGMPSVFTGDTDLRAEFYQEEDDGRSFGRYMPRYTKSGRFLRIRLPRIKDVDTVASTTPAAPTTSTTSNPLEEYRLKDFPWTESLLNRSADTIAFQVNGTQVDLKLSKDLTKPYEVTTKAPVEHGKDSYLPLERLWAYLTIQQLLDERHITDLSDTDDKSPAKKALQLALKYEFVTALTSLVVVKPNATSAVDAESADRVSSNNYPALPSGLSFAPQRASSTYMAAQLSVPSHAGQSFYSGQLLAHALGQNSYPIALSGMPSPFADRLESPYLEEEDDDDTYHLLPVAYSRMPIAYSGMPSVFTGDTDLRAEFYQEEDDGRSFSRYMPRYTKSGRFLRMRLPRIKDVDSVASSTPATPTTSTTSNPLEEYRLKDFPWTESLLNRSADTIAFQANGTQVDLKLSKDLTAPSAASGDAECSNATDNATGLCVYLTRCHAAKDITADIYSRSYCVVGDSYAGVCCPRSEVDKAP